MNVCEYCGPVEAVNITPERVVVIHDDECALIRMIEETA